MMRWGCSNDFGCLSASCTSLTLLFVAYRESLGNSQLLTPAQLFFCRLDHYNILCVFLCERICLFFPCQNNVEVCMAYLVMSIDMKIRRFDSRTSSILNVNENAWQTWQPSKVRNVTHEAVTNLEFKFGPNYVPIYLNIGKHGHQHIWASSKVS